MVEHFVLSCQKNFLVYEEMFIGSIIALTLSLSLLFFFIVLIVIQRVRAQRKMQAEQERTPTPPHTVIPSNFIAPGATPPPSRRGGPNIVGKPVL